MDAKRIQEYVERSRSIIEQSPQMDEQNTKAKLIQPFVELLGWDIYSQSVELEYPIKMGVGTKKVDYALQIEDTPKVVVEAKGLDTTITDSHISQLTSYMRQELSVNWGILTNGEDFHVYRKDGESAGGGESKIGEFTIEDFATNPEVLDLLSKESIASGHSDDVVQQLQETKQAIDVLGNQKAKISQDVAEVITGEIGDVNALEIETESKEFVDKLKRSLESRASLVDGKINRPSEPDGKGWTPKKGANAVKGTMSRENLEGPDDATVVVFPCKESGLQFLQENNAWGFVRIGQIPDYAAFYITRTEREVQYVAKVEDIVEPEQADLSRPLEEYNGRQVTFDPNKRVVEFEYGTLYELDDSIPFGEEYPQSHRYTDLGRLKEAEITDDLF